MKAQERLGDSEMESNFSFSAIRQSDRVSAATDLFNLQVAQMRHDELYHKEIVRLTVQARLNHMALHFCKYVGQFAEAVVTANDFLIRRTIVDALIIDLCACNALNIRLSNFIPGADNPDASLVDLARDLYREESLLMNDNQWLLSAYAVQAGHVARACEKIDHLEAFPFRESISGALGVIGRLSLVAAERFEFNLIPAVGRVPPRGVGAVGK